MNLKYIEPEKSFYADKDIRDAWLQDPEGPLPLIRFHSLDELEWLDACFTTRRGGVSTGYLAELNLGLERGDVPYNVWANYRRVAERLGLPLSRMVLTRQVHETEILYADESLTLGDPPRRKTEGTDGLFTDIPRILLSATFADCVPVYLADPGTRTIALVHSGWKGTVGEISRKAVEILAARGADPAQIVAVTGPCISEERYEVTGEVTEAFRRVFSPEAMGHIARQTDDIHWQLDLPAAIWHSLRAAGVKSDHIHFSGVCTFDNPGLYSHRRTHGKRGNMNAFLFIR